jgi:hypothetical protein
MTNSAMDNVVSLVCLRLEVFITVRDITASELEAKMAFNSNWSYLN